LQIKCRFNIVYAFDYYKKEERLAINSKKREPNLVSIEREDKDFDISCVFDLEKLLLFKL